MNCVEAQRKIRPYLEDQLPDEEMAPFLKHIRKCEDCRENLQIYTVVYSTLDNDDEEAQPDYNFDRIMEERLTTSELTLQKREQKAFLTRLALVLAQLLLVYTLYTSIHSHMELNEEAGRFEYVTVVQGQSELPEDTAETEIIVSAAQEGETDE